MNAGIHVKKCQACGIYTDAKIENCAHCGHLIHETRRKELKKRGAVEDIHIPIWRINKEDPIWLQILKRPIQLVQLMLYGIVAFFIYLATAFAH